MKVKTLVKILKDMPQDLEVGYQRHDNAEYEIAGYVCSVDHFVKSDFTGHHDELFESIPEELVVLRG